MNDVMYRLFTITGDTKHLLLVHILDKPCFLSLLALKADDLSGVHANTHIPIVLGAQMRYEFTCESLYKEIGMFFMDTVNSLTCMLQEGHQCLNFDRTGKTINHLADEE